MTKKLSQGQKAYKLGYTARCHGAKMSNCPYHRGVKLAGWLQGWVSANLIIQLGYLKGKK